MASFSSSRASPARYSASAKLMHWLVAVSVIALIAIGPVMKRLVPKDSLRDNLYNFHEALGALVLIVMVIRRTAFGVPAPDPTMPPLEQRASLWAQYALYLLLIVTTLLGWAATNAYGDPVSVFGLFDFPALLGKDQPLSDRIFVWHLVCGILSSDRRAPCRRRPLSLAHQARSRAPAHAAGELSGRRRLAPLSAQPLCDPSRRAPPHSIGAAKVIVRGRRPTCEHSSTARRCSPPRIW